MNLILVGGRGAEGANFVNATPPTFVDGFQRLVAQIDPGAIFKVLSGHFCKFHFGLGERGAEGG